MISFDANAGIPLKASVAGELARLLGEPARLSSLGNPSSSHAFGRATRRLVEEARAAVLRSLLSPAARAELPPRLNEIVFTSSATEALHAAIRGVLEARLLAGAEPSRLHWITTAVEHDAVLQIVAWSEKRGIPVTVLPVDANGLPRLEDFEAAIRPGETALVSLIWVNNETGVVLDAGSWIRAARGRGILVVLDGAQAWGKIPVELDRLQPDFAAFSPQKIGGLPGTGVLWVSRALEKSGRPVEPLVPGKTEGRRRGGTQNWLGIVAAGLAAREVDPARFAEEVLSLRATLESEVRSRIPSVIINGEGVPRIANTSSLSFPQGEGEGLVAALDLAGFAVSAGSACSSGTLQPSHVLLAMGRDERLAKASIRVSFAGNESAEAVKRFAEVLAQTTERLAGHGASAKAAGIGQSGPFAGS